MQIGILQQGHPDSNQLLSAAITRVGLQPVYLALDKNLEKEMTNCAGYIIGSGLFELPLDGQPLLSALKQQSELGKPILGIGEGAIVLTEAGLIPGIEGNKKCISVLEPSDKEKKEAILQLTQDYQYNAFTRFLRDNQLLTLSPYPYYEFLVPPALRLEMEAQGLIIFTDSQQGHAAVALANKAGNVMGMLPDPASSEAGDVLFLSMKDYISVGYRPRVRPLYYYPRN